MAIREIEPLEGNQKLRLLQQCPAPRRFWFKFCYTEHERQRKIEFTILFRALKVYQKITCVVLSGPPAAHEKPALSALVAMESIRSLGLIGWSEEDCHFLLSYTTPLLYRLGLACITPSALSLSETITTPERADCDIPAKNSVLHFRLKELPVFATLGDFDLRQTPPLESLSELQATLERLNLDFEQSERFETGRFALDHPLEISNLTNLKVLTLDGGHDRNQVLPIQFFSQRSLRNLSNLRFLDIGYCSVAFVGFLDFANWFFASRKDAWLSIRLFFGEWSPLELQRALAYKDSLTAKGRDVAFHLFEGREEAEWTSLSFFDQLVDDADVFMGLYEVQKEKGGEVEDF
ncbi:hypothetical protein BT69DRAFT_1290880 [Atractiella rhizophila]|nr:hypothetical protein BT69DRAFT_1290880 [Atractiella rhizophila]